jgi:peptide/nickel transport system substrate-binding protein
MRNAQIRPVRLDRELINRRSLLLAAGALAGAGALRGFAPGIAVAQDSPEPDGNQSLRVAIENDVLNLDPVQANDSNSIPVYGLIHDPIALVDSTGTVTPNLAESWEKSEDSLTYTYTFRQGVTFHDGSPLTADDVVFTIDRIMANAFPAGRKKEKIDMIASYQKTGDYTVEVTLQYPYAPFPAAFGLQSIQPKAVIAAMGEEAYGQKPVGCGPFKAVEWVANDHVKVERYDGYWLKQPMLTDVEFRPIPESTVAAANMLAGDVDASLYVTSASLKALSGDDSIEVLNKTGLSYFFGGFRMKQAPFTDLRFRKAVYFSTDFDAAIASTFEPEIAVRAYGPVPPGLWPQDGDYLKSIAPKQDKDEARRLFDELIAEGVMAADYKIPILPYPEDARGKIAEILITNLKEIGVDLDVIRLDRAAYSAHVRTTEDNCIFFFGTTPSFPDPDANLRWLYGKEGVHGGYLNIAALPEDEAWEASLRTAQQSQDQAEREQIYTDLQRQFVENVLHLPLYYLNALLAKKKYVQQLDVDPGLGALDLVTPDVNVYLSGR